MYRSDVFLLYYWGGDDLLKVIICLSDCSKSICMNDVFLPYYWRGDNVLKVLSEPKTKTSLSKKRIKGIRKDFNKLRDRFLKPKIKEIRRNLYEIENKKNLSESKIKEIEQNLIELEESLFKLNKYYDYDDIEYKGIRDVENLFSQSTD